MINRLFEVGFSGEFLSLVCHRYYFNISLTFDKFYSLHFDLIDF